MKAYESYVNRGIVGNWSELIKLSEQEIIDLQKRWNETQKYNEEVVNERRELRSKKINEVIEELNDKGIDVYKYSSRGIIKKKTGYVAWFKKNVVEVIERAHSTNAPEYPRCYIDNDVVNGIIVRRRLFNTDIESLYKHIKSVYEQTKRDMDKNNKLLIESIKLAGKKGWDIEGLEGEEIIDVVREHAITEYLAEEVPDGTEVYLKHECSECSEYIVGERRCSCGNRRIGITVEGDIVQGFYYYVEAY